MKKLILLAGALGWIALGAEQTVYVGTYTSGNSSSKGIYAFRFDNQTGRMTEPSLAVESESPSFLTLSKDGRFLYAVNESGSGSVSAFAVEAPGKLRLLNTVPSQGQSPCHLNFDRSGRWLAVANYSSGTVAIFPVGADGKLGSAVEVVQHKGSSIDKNRQSGPHAHSVNFSKDGKHLFVADLGLDQTKVYAFSKKNGKLKEIARLQAPQGGGPRHASLGKNGLVYVVNEMGSSVSSFRWTGAETTSPIATVGALPAGFSGRSSGAEVLLHRGGKLVFSSNRGHDSIAVFATNPIDGQLRFVRAVPIGGKTPRGFVLSPDAKYLLAAGQDSDLVTAFRIDTKGQNLEKVGESIRVGRPVCLRFAR